MATLYKEKNANYRIQFSDGNGNRKSIRLGKVPKKTAETIRSRVEEMISCRLMGASFSAETSAWLGNLPRDMLEKLSRAGFEVRARHTAEELWAGFLAQKSDVGKTTLDGYDYVEQRFFAFFERKIDLDELTSAHFEQWKTFLRTEYASPRTGRPLVESTVAGTLTKAKAVFNWGVRVGWLEKSPLGGVGRGSFVNQKNDYHVTMNEFRRLLEACPCRDWRCIITLARIGGLHPCEILNLRWADMDWAQGRFNAFNTKLKKHAGKYVREVPIFPELAEELEKLRSVPGNADREFVINRYPRREGCNLVTQFDRISDRAGLGKIPRPFDNMRASRSTEIYAEFGAFLESKWIGHSTKTAMKHYLQVRDEDFARAVGRRIVSQVPVQKAVRQASAASRKERQENAESPQIAGSRDSVQDPARSKYAEERTGTGAAKQGVLHDFSKSFCEFFCKPPPGGFFSS